MMQATCAALLLHWGGLSPEQTWQSVHAHPGANLRGFGDGHALLLNLGLDVRARETSGYRVVAVVVALAAAVVVVVLVGGGEGGGVG